MNYLWNELKYASITHLVCAFIFAAFPWMSGPYIIDVIGIFLVSTVLRVAFMMARTVWLTVRNRSQNNS